MNTPLRIMAYYRDETQPSWFITLNRGRDFFRAGGDWIMATVDDLAMTGHGHNDPQLAKLFDTKHRAGYQPPRG